MKKVYFLSLFLLVISTLTAVGQTFNSRDEFRGSWSTGSSWVGGAAPGTVDIQNSNILIQGYITRSGNLSFKNNATLTVDSYDTLVVSGDVVFNNNTTLTVRTGGVLVVVGNITSHNNIDVASF